MLSTMMASAQRSSLLAFTATLLLLPMAVGHAAPAKTAPAKTRKVVNGAFEISWSAQEAVARRRGQKKPIVIYRDKKKGDNHETHTLRSIVGPIVSYRLEWYSEGGAHPSFGSVFRTLDLTTGKPARLDRLFGAGPVLAALRADRVIKKALGARKPKTLEELLRSADGGCKMDIGTSALSAFTFHHVVGDKVAVRIGLSHGCEAERGKFTQLGLLLPIPRAWRAAFAHAAKQRTLQTHLAAPRRR